MDAIRETLLNTFVAGWLILSFFTRLEGLIVTQLEHSGLRGRFDIFLALLVTLMVFVAINKRIQALSDTCTPHARYWNWFVSIVLAAIRFLLFYANKTYLEVLVIGGLETLPFNATFLVVILLYTTLIIGIYIFFQKYADLDLDAPMERTPFG